MTRLQALIWDVDGTLAETERDGHRVAFNMAFEACAVPWRRFDWFAVMVCGEDVQDKKPDPEVYHRVLTALRIGPLAAVAIEDAPAGVAAARAVDVPVVVTRSGYFAHAPIEGAVAVGPGLHDRHGWRPVLRTGPDQACQVGIDDIQDWCAQMDSVCDYP
jgi:beta-phosphoglucomutase-like phosphatase (HAD superfamily)